MKEIWALLGTLGDTFGGLANVGTLLVALWAVRTARTESVRNREQKLMEMRSDTALKVWSPAQRHADAVINWAHGSQRDFFRFMTREYPTHLADEFARARADVDLLFDDSVRNPFAELHNAIQKVSAAALKLQEPNCVHNYDLEQLATDVDHGIGEIKVALDRAREGLRRHAHLELLTM